MPAYLYPNGILGMERKAYLEEIRTAYRRLALRLHPDVNPEPDAADRFKELHWAYELLTDSRNRNRFDEGTPSEDTISVDVATCEPGRSSADSEPDQNWRKHWHVWIAEKDVDGEKVVFHKDHLPFFKRHLAGLHGKHVQTFQWGFSALQCMPHLDGCRWKTWRPTIDDYRRYATEALYMFWRRQAWEQAYDAYARSQ